jgi:hypothetical protein
MWGASASSAPCRACSSLVAAGDGASEAARERGREREREREREKKPRIERHCAIGRKQCC